MICEFTHCFSLILRLILDRDSRGKILAESSLVELRWKQHRVEICRLTAHLSMNNVTAQTHESYHCLVMSNIMMTPLQFLYTSRNSASRATSSDCDTSRLPPFTLCLFLYDRVWDMNCSLMTLEASRNVTITSWGSFSSFKLSPRLLPLPELTH